MADATSDEALEPVPNHPCDQCGQLDDHPVVHVYELTYHFDCLPHRYESLLGDDPHGRNIKAGIAAARKGTRGAKLRTLIAKQTVPAEED